MKVLILEDEILIAYSLRKVLNDIGYESVVICNNCEDAEAGIKLEKPDLAIIDIQIHGELRGIEFAKLCKGMGISFIFITAFSNPDVIIEATETAPITYLTKPYKESDLRAAMAIAKSKINKNKALKLTDGKKEYNISLDEVLYLEADTPYVKIYRENGVIVLRNSISRLIETINDDSLVRIHKSYAINKNKMQEKGINYVVINEVKLPVSKVYR